MKIRVKEYTVEVLNDNLEATSLVTVAEVAAEPLADARQVPWFGLLSGVPKLALSCHVTPCRVCVPCCSDFMLRIQTNDRGTVVAENATGGYQWRVDLGVPIHGVYTAPAGDVDRLRRSAHILLGGLMAIGLHPVRCGDASVTVLTRRRRLDEPCVALSPVAPQGALCRVVGGQWSSQRVDDAGRVRATNHDQDCKQLRCPWVGDGLPLGWGNAPGGGWAVWLSAVPPSRDYRVPVCMWDICICVCVCLPACLCVLCESQLVASSSLWTGT